MELRGESAAGFPQSRNWEKLALFFNSLTGDATRKLTVFSLFKRKMSDGKYYVNNDTMKFSFLVVFIEKYKICSGKVSN